MAGNLKSFFDKLGVNIGGTDSSKGNIDQKILESLAENFKEMSNTMEDLNEELTNSKLNAKLLIRQQNVLNASSAEYLKIEEERKKLDAEILSLEIAQLKVNKDFKTYLQESAESNKVNSKKLEASLDDLVSNYSSTAKKLSGGQQLFSGITKGLGTAFSGIGGNIKEFISNPLTGLATAGELAGKQIIDLNDKLIKFGRDAGQALNYQTLGFDKYGNNTAGSVGSLQTKADTNGLNTDEILKTFDAFKQGSGVAGGVDMDGKQKELQNYGVEVAKLNKFYGVGAEKTSAISKVLTQQYGKGIDETAKILEKGAKSAKAAGLNVGMFFDNMQAISELDLYVAGGADGLAKAAESVTRLGVSASSLQKITEDYGSMNDLIDKQQRANAMGLQNLSAVQNQIFAKTQLGDAEGAKRLQLGAAAKDIQRDTIDGKIDNKGRQKLKSQGLSKEDIDAIERLSKKAKETGLSLEEVTAGAYRSAEASKKAAKYDAEQLTVTEKLMAMYGNLKAIIVDPIAAVVAPIFDFFLNVLGTTFKTLHTILTPLIWTFEQIGKFLSGITGEGSITKVLGNILAVLVGWKLFSMAKDAAGSGGDAISGLLEKVGGKKGLKGLGEQAKEFISSSATGKMGLLKGGLKGALKGGVIGSAAAMGGEAIGGLISGDEQTEGKDRSGKKRTGDTISSVAQYAGMGAMLGPIGAGIGAAVGAIVANWDVISEWLGELWDSISGVAKGIWSVVKFVMPLSLIWEGIKAIAEWCGWSKNDKEKENTVKISGIARQGGSTLPDISKIMEQRTYNTTLQAKSEQENMVNSSNTSNRQPIVIKITHDTAAVKSKVMGNG